MYRYLTSILIITCGLCCGSRASEASSNASPQPACVDSDSDGLEDSFEVELGTDPARADSDGDGLCDYDEHCKYRTDPTKKDTDGDGTPDADWAERREYAYTIRAICEIRPPNTIEGMNDLYQDARPADRKARLQDGTVVEVLLFPFSQPHVLAQPYPRTTIPDAMQRYVERDLSMNYSDEMQKEIKEQIVRGATTDVEAIEKILAWMARETTLANRLPEFAYFNVVDNKIVWRQSLGSPQKDEQFLQTDFFGDAMFRSRLHGTCSSTATLRATMLRAAGIPTRLIQNLPLINRYEGDPEPLQESLRMRVMAKGYDWGQGGGGANHYYNEVFLNNRWVRVDSVINPGPFVGDKLFVRVYSLASWNDRVDWRTPRPEEEHWNENRDFRTLEVSDTYAKYRSAATTIDIAVDDTSLDVKPNADGSFTAMITIRNKGVAPSPRFGVYFYAGDPQKQGRLLATHGSGPIMPGGTWREYNPQLRLQPDEDTIVVIVDPQSKVQELDESNNKASHVIEGRGAERSSAAQEGGPVRRRHFVTIVIGEDKMTFQGQEATWEQLPALLEKVPDRPQTVLQLAVTSHDIESREDWDDTIHRVSELHHRYGFEYPSLIGVQPLGAKGGPSQLLPSESPSKP
ncbi:MAG: transglutaminase domain-containing protein [Phycisphaerales bacterium]